jgi:hypothetical protein
MNVRLDVISNSATNPVCVKTKANCDCYLISVMEYTTETFPSGFLTKILYAHLISPMCATWSAISSSLTWSL